MRNESELTNQWKEFWIEGRINEAVNQEGENGFEGTKKKPISGTQKERKYGLQVRQLRLPEFGRQVKDVFFLDANG